MCLQRGVYLRTLEERIAHVHKTTHAIHAALMDRKKDFIYRKKNLWDIPTIEKNYIYL